MCRLRLPLAIPRQVYGRPGAAGWLLTMAAGIILIIWIAPWAKTAPAP